MGKADLNGSSFFFFPRPEKVAPQSHFDRGVPSPFTSDFHAGLRSILAVPAPILDPLRVALGIGQLPLPRPSGPDPIVFSPPPRAPGP